MDKKSTWTGERFETEYTNETMLEHLHRYTLVLQFVKGKNVLDIACGEGYGSNLLANHSKSVSAIDIDLKTIEKAKLKYNKENLTFTQGSILEISANKEYFDVITCFETLEHIIEHEAAINELKRVLAPGGLVLISTPEKSNYSDIRKFKNPYHLKELYKDELIHLLKPKFQHIKILGQNSYCSSFITNEINTPVKTYFSGTNSETFNIQTPPTMYWIAIASDSELPQINDSYFIHPDSISTIQLKQAEALKRTFSYRLGHTLLSPFNAIRSLFRK